MCERIYFRKISQYLLIYSTRISQVMIPGHRFRTDPVSNRPQRLISELNWTILAANGREIYTVFKNAILVQIHSHLSPKITENVPFNRSSLLALFLYRKRAIGWPEPSAGLTEYD